MGMAASQARFLGLTARKTNVEYEGQQINQQRTTLSNQTANYYNQLLGMSVPVPPSVEDYTKTVYTFEDGSLTNSITSMIAQGNGNYIISYVSSYIDDFSAVSAPSNKIVTRNVNESLTEVTPFASGTLSGIKREGFDPDYTYSYDGHPLSKKEFAAETDIVPESLRKSNGGPLEANKTYYSYVTTENGSQVTHYISADDLESAGKFQISNGTDANIYKEGGAYKYGNNHTLTLKTFDDEHKAPEGITPRTGEFYMFTDEETGEDYYFEKSAIENAEYDPETNKIKSNVTHFVDNHTATSATSYASMVEYYQYSVGARKMRVLGSDDIKNADNELRNSDEYYKTLSQDQIEKLLAEEAMEIEVLNKQYGDDSKWMVRYEYNSSAKTWEPFFTKLNILGNTIYNDETDGSLSYVPMYTIGSAQKTEEIKHVPAIFEQDSTGRLINVTLRPGQDDEITYAVATTTMTDQAKYDDAMNQYEYDKAKYDQAIQEINAKIEIIQAEDKNLELRLKQLDTEQDAISTEMDAVQKIIEKNVESTFKTFG